MRGQDKDNQERQQFLHFLIIGITLIVFSHVSIQYRTIGNDYRLFSGAMMGDYRSKWLSMVVLGHHN